MESRFVNKLMMIVGLCLCCISCKQKPSDEALASGLLEEARACYRGEQYERANALIDSLRSCYPLAFEARRAAILLEDSIGIDEGKAEYEQALRALQAREDELAIVQKEQSNDIHALVVAEAKRDTAAMLVDRKDKKIRFYERKLCEDKLKIEN